MSELEAVVIDDAVWDELISLSGGDAAVCYQCGTCTASCPWGLVSEETVSIRTLIREAQLGIPQNIENLWLCTTCGYCEGYCPRGVDISRVILALRQIIWHRRDIPEGLPSLLWSIYWNNNPWSQPPSQRSLWAKSLDIPYYDSNRHEILLYIGCTSSYDSRDQLIAKAIVNLLRAAGVRFGILMDDEPCCGETAKSLGHQLYYEDAARKAAGIFEENNVSSMVVISPHCFDAFKNHNPYLEPELVVMHYTTFLAGLLESGKLVFSKPVELRTTYHDPCYLARHNSEFVGARTILESIPALKFVEMDRTEGQTLCCGAGGGRLWMETDPEMRFSDLQIKQAQGIGAEMLATSCPFCLTCFEDSVKSVKDVDLVVSDVAELAAMAL